MKIVSCSYLSCTIFRVQSFLPPGGAEASRRARRMVRGALAELFIDLTVVSRGVVVSEKVEVVCGGWGEKKVFAELLIIVFCLSDCRRRAR